MTSRRRLAALALLAAFAYAQGPMAFAAPDPKTDDPDCRRCWKLDEAPADARLAHSHKKGEGGEDEQCEHCWKRSAPFETVGA